MNLDRLIDEIKQQANIVDVVNHYVKLKRAGDSYKGCCPFHKERNPSFSVNSKRQFYKCFSCNESGDIITFAMKIESLSFVEALRFLAARCGIALDDNIDRGQYRKHSPSDLAAKAESAAKDELAQIGLTWLLQRRLAAAKENLDYEDAPSQIRVFQLTELLDRVAHWSGRELRDALREMMRREPQTVSAFIAEAEEAQASLATAICGASAGAEAA